MSGSTVGVRYSIVLSLNFSNSCVKAYVADFKVLRKYKSYLKSKVNQNLNFTLVCSYMKNVEIMMFKVHVSYLESKQRRTKRIRKGEFLLMSFSLRYLAVRYGDIIDKSKSH